MRNRSFNLSLLRVLDTLPLVVPVALAAFGAVATFLLVLGQLRSELVWPFGLLAAIAATIAVQRYYPYDRTVDKELNICNALAVLGVLAWGAFNILFTSQHVLTNRDPGTYANAGAWLVHHNNINISIPTVFGTGHGVVPFSAGFAGVNGHNQIFAQGLHLLPIYLGLAGRILGDKAMLHINVLFGMAALIAVYAFARQLGRQRWALVITVALAVSMPMIYFSRDTYTEPLAVTFTFGSLALMWAAQKNGKIWLWFLAGLVAAAGTFTRIDGFLTVAGFCMFLVVWLVMARRSEHQVRIRQSAALLVGMAISGILGWLDASRLSTQYYQSLHSQFHQELLLIAAALFFGAIATWIAWRTSILRTLDKKTASWRMPAAAAAILIVAIILISRPLWFGGVGPIHPAKIIGTEVQAEFSTAWLSWYLGPILALLGTLGLAIAAARAVKRRDSLLLCGLIVICLTALVYLIKPSIALDQIWASRRLLPVIMPGVAAFAVITMDWAYEEYYHRIRHGLVFAILVIIAILLGPILTSKPLLFRRDTLESAPITAVCNSAPKNAAVLWLGTGRLQAVMPTRSICGMPAVGYDTTVTDSPSQSDLKTIAAHVRASGHTPLVGLFGSQAGLISAAERPNLTAISRYSYWQLDNPRTTPPTTMLNWPNSVLLAIIQPDGNLKSLNSGK